jgi:tryptophanyl-tRNA synthetase
MRVGLTALALTTVKIRENLNRQVYEVAATWPALGLNPESE